MAREGTKIKSDGEVLVPESHRAAVVEVTAWRACGSMALEGDPERHGSTVQ